LVRDNGLEHLVDDIVSVEDFSIWKPQTELYRLAALKHACAPANALLVAAHARDVHGAIQAGFHGIWVQRQESFYHPLRVTLMGRLLAWSMRWVLEFNGSGENRYTAMAY